MKKVSSAGLAYPISRSNIWRKSGARSAGFPVLNQIELHPLYQERDLCAYCRENGIRLVAWGPLFRGKLMQHPAIVEIAAAHGKTPGQLSALAYPERAHRHPQIKHESRIHENGRRVFLHTYTGRYGSD